MKRHVLFVCLANVNRSPTAERMFKKMSEAAGYRLWNETGALDYDTWVMSAGTYAAEGRRQMSAELGDWATEIYAMDGRVRQFILDCCGQPASKTISFGIADIYRSDDYELERVLREKLAPLVRSPFGRETPEAAWD